MDMNQFHLNRRKQIDLGSFYTPKKIVDLAYEILRKNVPEISSFTILDSSCGYGSFFRENVGKRMIGADVDPEALENSRKSAKNVELFQTNSLKNISRKNYKILENEKLIVVGNPPYNDTTSIIHQETKDKSANEEIDQDVKTRDLGMSFLLSYDKLKADYICVLHPLSYLIKKANFALLKNFAKNYKLIDGMVISSHEFSDTSRAMAFPILIALYRRGESMNYDDIKDYEFPTKEGEIFRIRDYDTIANYISKYPNKNFAKNAVAKFYTMRDINALKRSRTFIENDMANTVYVALDKLPYYCYVDVFKRHADKIPYYFGNMDVFINKKEFAQIKDCFVADSVKNNPIFAKNFKFREIPDAQEKIEKYFAKLLGENYATN